MTQGWIIVARTNRISGEPSSGLRTEYFAVALADQMGALELLKSREDYLGSELMIAGEVTPEFLRYLDMREGQIMTLWATD
jgi:hypothetical protein